MRYYELENALVAFEPIIPGSRGSRRERESAAVRKILHNLFGDEVSLDHLESGAPILRGIDGVSISISHSAYMAVVALTQGIPIGVDSETLRPQLERVIHKYMSPAEQAVLETPEQHLVAWCIKEAAYKCAGLAGVDFTHGISIDADNDTVTVCCGDARVTMNFTVVENRNETVTVIALPANL